MRTSPWRRGEGSLGRMGARLLCVVLVAVGTVLVAAPSEADETKPPVACTPRESCCAICTKGKACGNACIQARKTCHKGRGCSCNESEICPAGT